MKPQSGRNKQDIRIGNAETSEDMDKAIEILKKHGLDKEYGISANTKAGG
jgi:translation elongation factor EF-Ts